MQPGDEPKSRRNPLSGPRPLWEYPLGAGYRVDENSMSWEALGAIAEALDAIGVIATLVYLSAQIRQNNNQLRGAATTAIYEYHRTLTEMLSSDPEL